MSSKPKDPYLAELARGASLAFANAEDLFQEGKTLFACISEQDADMIVVYSEGVRRFELEQNRP